MLDSSGSSVDAVPVSPRLICEHYRKDSLVSSTRRLTSTPRRDRAPRHPTGAEEQRRKRQPCVGATPLAWALPGFRNGHPSAPAITVRRRWRRSSGRSGSAVNASIPRGYSTSGPG
jgi:hypothetical protein